VIEGPAGACQREKGPASLAFLLSSLSVSVLKPFNKPSKRLYNCFPLANQGLTRAAEDFPTAARTLRPMQEI
jgi:hypothetical protein